MGEERCVQTACLLIYTRTHAHASTRSPIDGNDRVVLRAALADGDRDLLPRGNVAGHVKFKKLVRPGQKIEQLVTLKEEMAGAYIFKAKITCEGKLAVSFEFIVTLIDKFEDED